MDFLEYLNSLLSKHHIPGALCLPLRECKILRPYKLKRHFDSTDGLNVCMIAVPYYAKGETGNISEYARARDYHAFFDMLWADVLPMLKEKYPSYIFYGFSDNSPIDERDAAAKCGLGILGQHGLLITEKYSSYVFLGEIITDLPIEGAKAVDIKYCKGCGACKRSCPREVCGICLSELTQKKGTLTPDEQSIIKKYGTAWGCDICSQVCPHTKRAISEKTIYTDIDFFKNDRIEHLDENVILNMSDEEFSLRAYSWRGRDTVLRNIEVIKHRKEEQA